jgi:hypothetical protein
MANKESVTTLIFAVTEYEFKIQVARWNILIPKKCIFDIFIEAVAWKN